MAELKVEKSPIITIGDVSNAELKGSFDISSEEGFPSGITGNGNTLYSLGNSSDTIIEWDFSNGINGLVENESLNISATVPSSEGLDIHNNEIAILETSETIQFLDVSNGLSNGTFGTPLNLSSIVGSNCRDIHYDENGIYLIDSNNRLIYQVSRQGILIETFDLSSVQTSGYTGISIYKNNLYTVYQGGDVEVFQFDLSKGLSNITLINKINTRPDSEPTYNFPLGLFVEDGNIFTVEINTDKIYHFQQPKSNAVAVHNPIEWEFSGAVESGELIDEANKNFDYNNPTGTYTSLGIYDFEADFGDGGLSPSLSFYDSVNKSISFSLEGYQAGLDFHTTKLLSPEHTYLLNVSIVNNNFSGYSLYVYTDKGLFTTIPSSSSDIESLSFTVPSYGIYYIGLRLYNFYNVNVSAVISSFSLTIPSLISQESNYIEYTVKKYVNDPSTIETISTIKDIPDSQGNARLDISAIAKSYTDFIYPTLDFETQDTYFIRVEYQTVVDGIGQGVFILDDIQIIQAAKQIGDAYGQNMGDYVLNPLMTDTKLPITAKEPCIYKGYPSYLSTYVKDIQEPFSGTPILTANQDQGGDWGDDGTLTSVNDYCIVVKITTPQSNPNTNIYGEVIYEFGNSSIIFGSSCVLQNDMRLAFFHNPNGTDNPNMTSDVLQNNTQYALVVKYDSTNNLVSAFIKEGISNFEWFNLGLNPSTSSLGTFAIGPNPSGVGYINSTPGGFSSNTITGTTTFQGTISLFEVYDLKDDVNGASLDIKSLDNNKNELSSEIQTISDSKSKLVLNLDSYITNAAKNVSVVAQYQGNDISETKVFQVKDCVLENPFYVVYENTIGGMDSFMFEGEQEYGIKTKEIGRYSDNETDLSLKQSDTYQTGFTNTRDVQVVADIPVANKWAIENLAMSRNIFQVDENGNKTRLKIKAGTFKTEKTLDNTFELSITFELPSYNSLR